MKRRAFAALCAVVLSLSAFLPPMCALAAPAKAPNILFIGNSLTYYNDGVDKLTRGLVASADPSMVGRIASFTRSSISLAEHWQHGGALDKIREGGWDFVVLQEGRAKEALDRGSFFESVRKFDEKIRKSGAQTVLYMPWGRQMARFVAVEEFAEAYEKIGAELGIKVAPVGLAWARSVRERPELELFAPEMMRIHPNYAGSYLVVCVVYATIFEKSPVGLSFRPADLYPKLDPTDPKYNKWAQQLYDQVSIPDADIEYLQRIAWETVQDYRAQHPFMQAQ